MSYALGGGRGLTAVEGPWHSSQFQVRIPDLGPVNMFESAELVPPRAAAVSNYVGEAENSRQLNCF